jgi:hypothetical protein
MTSFSSLESRLVTATDLTATDPANSSLTQPIGVILSSSGEYRVLPGEMLEVSVTVNNKGNQSAIIDIFLDDLPVSIHTWCLNTQTRLALEPGQGEEVIFRFDIPLTALSGAYAYKIVVDAPLHYPDSPALRYEQVLQVLPPTHTTVRINDPTFAIDPATTRDKPLKIPPGNPLQFQVYVYNRADRVDRFRLACKDLPADWIKIHYPQGFQTPGLAAIEPYLNLNPGENGIILLTIMPPLDALAKLNLATLQLKSENNPELKLFEILYLDIKPIYQLATRFRTLVSRIQQQPGLYSVQATNQGNTPRTLEFGVLGLERNNLCDYAIEPPILTLAPQQTLTSQISVQPKNPWKRSLFGAGRVINFEVSATDLEQKPMVEIPMPGMLMWDARPWWQILPAVLLLSGSLAGLMLLIWWFFIRPPAPVSIVKFSPEATTYETNQGETVHLGFEIANAQRLQQIEIVGQSAEGDLLSGPLTFDLTHGLPTILANSCVQKKQRLTCRNVRTDARKSGDYIFTLTVIPQPGRNAQPVQAKALPVSIVPVQAPRIVAIAPTATLYTEAVPGAVKNANDPPSMARVNWTVDYPRQLRSLTLLARDEQGNAAAPALVYDFQQGLPDSLAEFCVLGRQLICNNVPTGIREAGTYKFDLTAVALANPASKGTEDARDEVLPIVATSEATRIQSRSPRLLSFTLNGEPAQASYLIPVEPGQMPTQLTLAWNVDNIPGTQVVLTPSPGTVPNQGNLPVMLSPQPGETVLSLQVIGATGEQITRSIRITTYDPTPEVPTIIVNTGTEAGNTATGSNTNSSGSVGDAILDGSNVGGRHNTTDQQDPNRSGIRSPGELPPQFE